MSLQSTVVYPIRRTYVLKLHRDAAPAQGRLCGRLEHIPTGRHVDFVTGEEMLAWLARHDPDGDLLEGPGPTES